MPNKNLTVESDQLWISKQHLLFLSSISIGLKGKILSNGLICATPLPMMVFLGIKVDLPVFKAAETIPAHPGKILTLFLAIIAVCTYRLVMISIERSETAQKSALEIQDKFSPRQNAVQNKINFENVFPNGQKNIFF